MDDSGYWIAGQLAEWPTKRRMASILRDAGLSITVGDYSIRVESCSRFTFEEYGGDLGEPQIEADADTLEEILRDGQLVSGALARVGIRHRFEIYNCRQPKLLGYVHCNWPLTIQSPETGKS